MNKFKLAILILVFLLSACSFITPKHQQEIWIDVRTLGEYAEGHYDLAVNIPHIDIEKRISEITTDKEAVINVYCRSGRRSGIAKEILEKMGYSNVINQGGLKDVLSMKAESDKN